MDGGPVGAGKLVYLVLVPCLIRSSAQDGRQIDRDWTIEGIVSAHRKATGRKFTVLPHEMFKWLISNRCARIVSSVVPGTH